MTKKKRNSKEGERKDKKRLQRQEKAGRAIKGQREREKKKKEWEGQVVTFRVICALSSNLKTVARQQPPLNLAHGLLTASNGLLMSRHLPLVTLTFTFSAKRFPGE